MRIEFRSFFPSNRAGLVAGFAVVALLAGAPALRAQDAAAPPAAQTTQTTAQPAQAEATLSVGTHKKKHLGSPSPSASRQTKDTKAELKKEAKYNPLIGKDEQLPDKQLYDKAMAQIKQRPLRRGAS